LRNTVCFLLERGRTDHVDRHVRQGGRQLRNLLVVEYVGRFPVVPHLREVLHGGEVAEIILADERDLLPQRRRQVPGLPEASLHHRLHVPQGQSQRVVGGGGQAP